MNSNLFWIAVNRFEEALDLEHILNEVSTDRYSYSFETCFNLNEGIDQTIREMEHAARKWANS